MTPRRIWERVPAHNALLLASVQLLFLLASCSGGLEANVSEASNVTSDGWNETAFLTNESISGAPYQPAETVLTSTPLPASGACENSSISDISRRNGPTSGGFTITILGSFVGTTSSSVQNVLFGSHPSPEVAWQSDTSVVAQAPVGFGSIETLRIETALGCSIENAPRTPTNVFSYDMPVLADMRASSSVPTEGGGAITFTGTNFGFQDFSPVVQVDSFYGGFLPSKGTRWVSDSSLLSVLPAGVGRARRIKVSVGGVEARMMCSTEGQPSAMLMNESSPSQTCFLVNYSAPVVSSVSPKLGLYTGESSLTVGGSSFGPKPPVGAEGPTIQVGEGACQKTSWVSQTSAVCVTSGGMGTFLPVKIVVGNQSSEGSSQVVGGVNLVSISFVNGSGPLSAAIDTYDTYDEVTCLLAPSPSSPFSQLDGLQTVLEDKFKNDLASLLFGYCSALFPGAQACGNYVRPEQVRISHVSLQRRREEVWWVRRGKGGREESAAGSLRSSTRSAILTFELLGNEMAPDSSSVLSEVSRSSSFSLYFSPFPRLSPPAVLLSCSPLTPFVLQLVLRMASNRMLWEIGVRKINAGAGWKEVEIACPR
eukprot:765278-Hanusia_phi.AAC.4